MQCHTLDFAGLSGGLPVLEHHFFVYGIVPNGRNNPVDVLEGRVYSAVPKYIQPRQGGKPFWVLEAQNVRCRASRYGLEFTGISLGYLVLVLGASEFWDTKDESGYDSYIETVAERKNDDGTKDLLLAIRGGIFKVEQQGTVRYLNCNSHRNTLRCLSESEYRKILKRDAAKAKQEAQKRAEVEAEEKRWRKRSEEVSAVGNISVFRHHSGVSLMPGHYRATDTYIKVVVPGDTEKPSRTISVDTPIRTQTGWRLITEKRVTALTQTCPVQIKLVGKREFEERDDGRRRNVTTWYNPDPDELKAWIERAVTVVSAPKEAVAK